MKLQERDIEILKVCYEQSFLLNGHVRDFFYEGRKQESLRRLKKLCEAGYLTKVENPGNSRADINRVTELGKVVALENGAREIKELAKISFSTLLHDAIVSSARLILSRAWNAEFKPERALKEDGGEEIPDGIFTLESGERIAVEVENSRKGKSRLIRLINRWEGVDDLLLVLYIPTGLDIERLLKRAISGSSTSQPIGVSRIEENKMSLRDIWTNKGPIDLSNLGACGA